METRMPQETVGKAVTLTGEGATSIAHVDILPRMATQAFEGERVMTNDKNLAGKLMNGMRIIVRPDCMEKLTVQDERHRFYEKLIDLPDQRWSSYR